MDLRFKGEKSCTTELIQFFGVPWFMPLRWSSPPSKAVKEANEGFRKVNLYLSGNRRVVDNKRNEKNLTEREIGSKDSFDSLTKSFGSRDRRSADNGRNCGNLNGVYVSINFYGSDYLVLLPPIQLRCH